MNQVLTDFIIHSAPKDCTREELINHIFTSINRADVTKNALARLDAAQAELERVPYDDRDFHWRSQYTDVLDGIRDAREACHHVIDIRCIGRCIICGAE